MNKPVRVPVPPDARDDVPVSQEEARIIHQRLATFEQDREAAQSADEVLKRLLRRHPTP